MCERTSTVEILVKHLKSQLAMSKFAFMPGADIWWLLEEGFGASEESMDELTDMWSLAVPQTDEKRRPVYPFKGTLCSYFEMDTASPVCAIARAPGHSFSWPVDDAASASEGGAGETDEYVRELIDPTTASGAAGHFRVHRAWPRGVELNSVVRALVRCHWPRSRGQHSRHSAPVGAPALQALSARFP